MHAQLEIAVIQFFHSHGIIQIFGIFAVDGDGQPVANVFSADFVFFFYFCFQMFDFRIYFIREFHCQFVSADDRQDVHSGIIHVPQNFHHFPFGVPSVFPVIDDFHNDFMAADRAFGMISGNKNILGNFLIIGYHKAEALVAAFEGTNDTLLASFQNFYDDPIGLFPFFRLMQHLIQNFILLHGTHSFAGRNKYIIAAFIGRYKTKSSGMADKRTGCHLQVFGRGQFAFFRFKNVTFVNELLQQFFKGGSVLCRHIHHHPQISALHGKIAVTFDISKDPFFPRLHNVILFHRDSPCFFLLFPKLSVL